MSTLVFALAMVTALAGGIAVGTSGVLPGVRRRLRQSLAARYELNEKVRQLRNARRCWICGHRMAYNTCCYHSEPVADSEWIGDPR